MAKKNKYGKKPSGHYCKVCGDRKANEKFCGKGHAKHVCKECDALPQERKNELQYLNRIAGIAGKYPRSRQDWEFLEKCAKNKKYLEAMEFAQIILDQSRNNSSPNDDELEGWETEEMNELFGKSETCTLASLDEELKEDITSILDEAIEDFILLKDYIPEEKDKQAIVDDLCLDISEGMCSRLESDGTLSRLYDTILKNVIGKLQEEGVKLKTFYESLVVLETDRLQIRKFMIDDFPNLYAIMQKEVVMYAWEHGFSKNGTRKWLRKQLTRYKKDGYGYWAVILKETNSLIGHVGLFKSVIDEKEVIELGYIFDDAFWGKGNCVESARKCVEFAFVNLKFDEIYCSIRPNNTASIHITQKIGMSKIGEHMVIYRDQEMPHYLYILRNE